MTALLPLLFATLTWNVLPGAVYVGLPSDVIVEQVCVETVCVTPDNPQLVVIPWEGEPPFVTIAKVRYPDGTRGQMVAIQLPNYTG